MATQVWETVPFEGVPTAEWVGTISSTGVVGTRYTLIPRIVTEDSNISIGTAASLQLATARLVAEQLIKMEARILTQAPAPGADFTFGLAQAVWGADPALGPAAADLPGSNFTIPAPAISSETWEESDYFTIPTTGTYMPSVVVSAVPAGGSSPIIQVKVFAT